ncbi:MULTISPECIES: Rap1a/Tai family immunity protein [unclassified Bradyrhizobium]|uniref:Rap1a/Tai family immunity protein n=1 Tax=unclassified Bradyrhizobium TaxID=2631580 RepID=UPI00291680CA|nr:MULTISPECIES: Rap1a/Tai family immunity protein [unclassified Bradyrhizobium]
MRPSMFVFVLATSAASAAEIPSHTFFNGNDVYGWCQHDRNASFMYVAGLFDEAAHAAAVIDGTRHWSKDMPKNDAEVDFALDRVVGYCVPAHSTVEQVTDVFCQYLTDNPAKRDGLPAILFSEALTNAWRCPKG